MTGVRSGGALVVTGAGRLGRETYLRITGDGRVSAYNGHVDLGTGLRTALAQIVAEELDVDPADVEMVLGDTSRTPDQGPTIASESIQIAAVPLRNAAAQARHALLARAARAFNAAPEELQVENGEVFVAGGDRRIGYGALIGEETIELELSADVAVKPVAEHRIVGTPHKRLDLPGKATAQITYVHDVRVDGMLHGRVVRPPYAGRDTGDFVGNSLISVDEGSIAHIPGIVAVVVIRDFVGIVAEREDDAERAMRALKVAWREPPPLPDLGDVPNALTSNPSTPRTLIDRGDVDAAIDGAAKRLERRYVWPYHLHGPIGPSCSVAHWQGDGLTLWSGTQNPHMLRADLSRLLEIPEHRIDIRRHEAAGCYGRTCMDDVGGDAALLSRAVGRPVRVQLSREQEHAWEPKGAAQLMEVRGGIAADGSPSGYDFETRYPSNRGPNLALLLTGVVKADPQPSDMGDRTAIPPYAYDDMRVVVHDMAPIVRAAWMRGVSAMPNSFAHESYVDELAAEAGVDPVEYRLRYLQDERAKELVKETAERAGWAPRTAPRLVAEGEIAYGQGFAYAVYVHGTFPGTAAAQAAWVAEVAVNRRTGEVVIERVVAGQDSGMMINPAGVKHQIHGNVVQSVSRVMKEKVAFSDTAVATKDWGSYPVLNFPELPRIEVVMMPRQSEPPLGVGESASVPSAAAIANAIYDATGVRFRELPFTPERIRAGLEGTALPPPAKAPSRPRRRLLGQLTTAAAAALTTAAVAWSWHTPIARIAPPDPSVWSAATIERGRQLASLGACAVCHTAEGGAINAGGRGIETPFGTVYATNITPDAETGIGAWSYTAFERAMRKGISRDGHHLYPAFPYTSFARTSDADMQALYAYLMSQAPVRAEVPESRLAFPFNLRAAMAGWNALFHRPGTLEPDPARSEAWNRGRYLVEGLGHCSGCHSPRNALGAEKTGRLHLAGGMAEGWEAPALTALSKSPVSWTENALYQYLRDGWSPHHGSAAGPMAPVIEELRELPDKDIRAMATYLGSLNDAPADGDLASLAARLASESHARLVEGHEAGARLFENACAICHGADALAAPDAPAIPLALNSSVHSDRPDNLIRVLLEGIPLPPRPLSGSMPSYAGAYSNGQIAEIAAYVRARFAPDRPAWEGLEDAVGHIRGG
ncbi:molybdopterin cofactor-binding domain-containing protein [Lutibaculum baratangense]|uniref:Isoquinoline 1-oxidoreductase beta subunit n=1 Tax=Lutibaculum baratangense AMV1 TaxID=631454 RepID=V4RIG5_9HYPH|nr:molybdopterin cofactor-binding domain-containing protein [Lutibaculum baratangense]ESR23075.1 Isoquinoline 1-oxidoreductase beta subunit [Lutibaculum baratangense AMV1]